MKQAGYNTPILVYSCNNLCLPCKKSLINHSDWTNELTNWTNWTTELTDTLSPKHYKSWTFQLFLWRTTMVSWRTNLVLWSKLFFKSSIYMMSIMVHFQTTWFHVEPSWITYGLSINHFSTLWNVAQWIEDCLWTNGFK